MRTITLRADNNFFDKVSLLAQRLHLSKSELIRRAVVEYEKNLQKRSMREQMKEASMRVREANEALLKDFDATLEDGLENV